MGRWEFRLRLLLRECDLIGEIALSEGQLHEIVNALQSLLDGEPDLALAEVCQLYSVTIAAFLTFTGVYWYNASGRAEYWASVWKHLPWPDTPAHRLVLAAAFRSVVASPNYRLLSLSRQTTRRHVDPILFHAMVPVECLPQLFEHIVAPLAEDPGLTWTDLSDALLPRPVRDFLGIAGRVADNFVERCARLLRVFERESGASPIELGERHGLAVHVVRAMADWVAAANARRSSRVSCRGSRVVFDPYQNGVELQIPVVRVSRVAPSFAAEVRAGDEVVKCEIPLDINNSEWTLASKCPAPAPAATYEVHIPDLYAQFKGRGGPADQPTYFSTRTGHRLPEGYLPSGEVWAVAPGHLEPRGDGGSAVIIEELPALPGTWRGLRAVTLDTSACTYIEWRSTKDLSIASETPVVLKSEDLPRLEGDPVQLPFVSTSGAPPVYTVLPHLWLPIRGGEGDYGRWHLSLTATGREPLFEGQLSAGQEWIQPSADGVLVALNHRELLAGLCGIAEITVRGPIGQDAQFVFAVLPGIVFETLPVEQMLLVEGRLGPCNLLIRSAAPVAVQATGGSVTCERGAHLVTPDRTAVEVGIELRIGDSLGERVQVPFRIVPVEWCFAVLPNRQEPQWAAVPLTLGAGEVRELVQQSLLVRTYFNEPVTLRATLLVNGQPTQAVSHRQQPGGPQRDRFDLSHFYDSLMAHSGEELALVLQIKGQGFHWELPAGLLELAWRVEDLSVSLQDCGVYRLEASWRDISQPKNPRRLVVRDLWRPGRSFAIPIDGNATAARGDFRQSDLLPGRYEVSFEAANPWRRTKRVPADVAPAAILSIGKDEWPELIARRDSPAEWLVAAYAWLDIGRPSSGDLVLPSEELWQDSNRLELAKLMIQAQRKGYLKRFTPLLKAWARDMGTLLRVCDAYAEEQPKEGVRSVAIALGLHLRQGSTASLQQHASYGAWPALASLHGALPLPLLKCHRQYAWGVAHQIRDPGSAIIGRSGGFHQEAPGLVLADWVSVPSSRRALRMNAGELDSAMQSLQATHGQLEKMHRARRQQGPAPEWGKGLAVLVEAYRHLLKAFQMRSDPLIGGELPYPTTTMKLAYVCAASALLQRFGAWQPRFSVITHRHPEWEAVCALCPPLHDYYLLLAEVYFRTAAE